mmetsp:Transcript_28363/g.81523  ORF Transcript_28363/g.81523 Transcript_28363/m.81523 type:complete len:205 (+) Transcript_28363:401-1015(+)
MSCAFRSALFVTCFSTLSAGSSWRSSQRLRGTPRMARRMRRTRGGRCAAATSGRCAASVGAPAPRAERRLPTTPTCSRLRRRPACCRGCSGLQRRGPRRTPRRLPAGPELPRCPSVARRGWRRPWRGCRRRLPRIRRRPGAGEDHGVSSGCSWAASWSSSHGSCHAVGRSTTPSWATATMATGQLILRRLCAPAPWPPSPRSCP